MQEEIMMPNLKIPKGGISDKVLVCGDPGRVKKISEMLDDAKELSFSREYRTVNGIYKGKKITVSSHGVGCPGAAVCFEELIKAGAKQIIRMGTAGSYVEEITPGSLLVADSAVREDGLTAQLVPKGMPAVSDFDLVKKLEDRVKESGVKYRRGTIVTLDAFYQGAIKFPHEQYKLSGAIGAEMELSALLIIARLRGVAAAGIFVTDGYADADMNDYNPHVDEVKNGTELGIEIALNALIS